MILLIPSVSIFLLVVMLHIRNQRFLFKYALLWLGFSFATLVQIIFPAFVNIAFESLGFKTPVNAIIIFSILFLAFMIFQVTLDLSKIRKQITSLSIHAALEAKKNES